MILSAGLTPAWQQLMVFDGFRYGEVNRAREVHWCVAGKVMNAGIAVHRFGGESLTLATVGGPPLESIEREFRAGGVPHRWVVTAAATRVCTTVIDRSTGTITELVENGRPLTAEEREAFRTAFAEEAARAKVVILIGSLPGGTPASFYRTLLEQTRCPAVLDFRGEGLLSVLDLRPYVVKPNREELAQTVGRPLESDDDLHAAMHSLNRRGAQWVVITQGGGPLWVTSADRAWRVHPLPVEEVVCPIGCGDAVAAGIAWGTREGWPLLDAVRLGVAAAATSLRQIRPGRLDAAEARRRMSEVRVEEV